MSPPWLSLKNLEKWYGQTRAVGGVSFDLAKGDGVALVGESGSGKSTLARIITGLTERSAGEIRFEGELLPIQFRHADFVRQARRIQLIFQDPASSLNPRKTVFEALSEAPLVHGLWKRPEVDQKVQDLLLSVGLAVEHVRRLPHQLSGGQKQRVSIARALALEPELLICDEPTSALDVSTQAQILDLLRDLHVRRGLSLILITHNLSIVRTLCTRMLVLKDGKVVEDGETDTLFFSPKTEYARTLISSHPIPDPNVSQLDAWRKLL